MNILKKLLQEIPEPFNRYDKSYTNGTSFTEGGGLEPHMVVQHYTNQYPDIPKWNDKKLVAWPHRLQEACGLPYDNQAACGGSSERMVRMTYAWLHKNWDMRSKVFLVLEAPDPWRIEVYLKKTKTYYIMNAYPRSGNFDWNALNDSCMHACVRDHWLEDPKQREEDQLRRNFFIKYFDRHIDLQEQALKNANAIIGLHSFCHLHNIPCFFQTQNCFSKFTITDKNVLPQGIHQFGEDNKLRVCDDIPDHSGDRHPGYFAHQQYADLVYQYLQDNL